MLKVLFLFPKTKTPDVVDAFIDTYVIPPLRSSPGFRSISMNAEPLMSPFGPPPYYKVVEATLEALADFTTIGQSDLIKSSADQTPEGMQILFYEFEG